MATEKQVNYVLYLQEDLQMISYQRRYYTREELEGMAGWTISDLINELKMDRQVNEDEIEWRYQEAYQSDIY